MSRYGGSMEVEEQILDIRTKQAVTEQAVLGMFRTGY